MRRFIKLLFSISVLVSGIRSSFVKGNERPSLFKFFQLLLVVFTFISFMAAIWGTFIKPNFVDTTSVYNVTANVEQVIVKTSIALPANWHLRNADISFSCNKVDEQSCVESEFGDLTSTLRNYTGSLRLEPNLEIIFTRVGLSYFIIQVSSLNRTANKKINAIADLYTDEEEFDKTLFDTFVIEFKNIAKRFDSGESLFFNITGDIQLADTKDYPDSYIKPILNSGEVSILEDTIFVGENYLIGPYSLDLGDSVTMQGKKGMADGFVSVTPTQGINVVYRVEAESATISRYKFAGYKISASMWNRLYHDQLLGYAWMLSVFFLTILSSIIEIPSTETKGRNE